MFYFQLLLTNSILKFPKYYKRQTIKPILSNKKFKIQQNSNIFYLTYNNQILFQSPKKQNTLNFQMACKTQTIKTKPFKDCDYSTPISKQHSHNNTKVKKDNIQQQYIENYENKLPINLFYSAAEYNKMIITNGKSIRKRSQPQIQNYVTNLQYINDPIFQSCQKKKDILRTKQKIDNKNSTDRKKNTAGISSECMCCCCDKFCKICSTQQNRTRQHYKSKSNRKITRQQLQKTLQKLNSLPLKKDKKKNKKKIITSQVHINQNYHDKIQRKQKGINSQKQCSSSYLSHKSFHIDNLISNSLMQLENMKKQKKLKNLLESRKRNQINKFDMEIRQRNKKFMQRPNSQPKISKKQQLRRMALEKNKRTQQYWENNREAIARQFQRYRLMKTKQKSLQRLSKSAVQSNVHTRYSPEQINLLRLKHEKQAKQKIKRQLKQKSVKKKIIQSHLEELELHRKLHIDTCQKKRFQPTPQMIDQAFKNIIEEPKPIVNTNKANMKKAKY